MIALLVIVVGSALGILGVTVAFNHQPKSQLAIESRDANFRRLQRAARVAQRVLDYDDTIPSLTPELRKELQRVIDEAS